MCNFMLDSNAYTRAQERNNHCILYHNPNQQSFSLIEHFLRIKTTDSRVHIVAVINKLDDMQKSLSSDQITEATAAHVITVQLQTERLHCIPVESIIMRCVFMQVASASYVSHLPNLMESD